VFGSILLFKAYHQQLSAAHYRISLLLMNGGAKSITIDRCARLSITVSRASAIRMQTKADRTSPKCISGKQDAIEKEFNIRFLEEVIKSSQDETPLDLSKDKVSHYKYFQEEMHDDILIIVHSVQERRASKELEL